MTSFSLTSLPLVVPRNIFYNLYSENNDHQGLSLRSREGEVSGQHSVSSVSSVVRFRILGLLPIQNFGFALLLGFCLSDLMWRTRLETVVGASRMAIIKLGMTLLI